MKKFEYHIIDFNDNAKSENTYHRWTDASLIEEELYHLGKDGWELVSVSNNCAFLKREFE